MRKKGEKKRLKRWTTHMIVFPLPGPLVAAHGGSPTSNPVSVLPTAWRHAGDTAALTGKIGIVDVAALIHVIPLLTLSGATGGGDCGCGLPQIRRAYRMACGAGSRYFWHGV